MKPAYYGNVRKLGIFPHSSLVPFYTGARSTDSRDCKDSPLKTDFRYAGSRLRQVSLYIIYFRDKFQIPASNPSSFFLIIPNAKENVQTTATVIFYILQIDYLNKSYISLHGVLSVTILHWSGANVVLTIRASAMFFYYWFWETENYDVGLTSSCQVQLTDGDTERFRAVYKLQAADCPCRRLQ